MHKYGKDDNDNDDDESNREGGRLLCMVGVRRGATNTLLLSVPDVKRVQAKSWLTEDTTGKRYYSSASKANWQVTESNKTVFAWVICRWIVFNRLPLFAPSLSCSGLWQVSTQGTQRLLRSSFSTTEHNSCCPSGESFWCILLSSPLRDFRCLNDNYGWTHCQTR